MKRSSLTLSALLLGTSTACVSTAPPVGPVTVTVGPAGATIVARHASGTEYKLTFPPGAVDADVDVGLRPLDAAGAALAAFEVTPGDLVLHQAATLEITHASLSSDETALRLDADGRAIYHPAAVGKGSLTAQLRFFSLPEDGHIWHGGAATTPANHLLGPAQAGDGATLTAVPADCPSRLAAARQAYEAFVAKEDFKAAVGAALTGASLAQECKDQEASGEFSEEIAPSACARRGQLVHLAQTKKADAYEVFTEVIQPVMTWESTLQALGVLCEGQPTTVELAGSKLSEFFSLYAQKLETLPAEYEALLDEARKVMALMGQASLLTLDDVEDQLTQDVLHPLLDMLRRASYEECLEASDHYYLYSLIEGPFLTKKVPIVPDLPPAAGSVLASHATFSDEALANDIQRCASRLMLEVWADSDVPEELTDKRVTIEPPAEPGGEVEKATTAGPVRGHLVLRGSVEQLRCGQPRTLVEHELVVWVEGQEVHRAATLDANPEVDIEATMQARGLSTEHVNDLDIAVRRESEACDGLYGSSDYRLFEVTYTADPPPRADAVSASPPGFAAETNAVVTFSLDWFDDGENAVRLLVRYRIGDKSATVEVDLANDPDAAGFTGKQGGGTYEETLFVYCSEAGEGPLIATFVLEDAYGQRSAEAEVAMQVSFADCGESASLLDRAGSVPAPSTETLGDRP